MRPKSYRGRGQRGQAIIEMALSVPFLMLLLLGGFDVSIMASNKVVSISSVRNGARLGAVYGGTGDALTPHKCNGAIPAPAADSIVDLPIVNSVLASTFPLHDKNNKHLSGMHDVVIHSIYIYQVPKARTSDGTFHVGTDLANQYDITEFINPDTSNKWVVTHNAGYPGSAFPLSVRCQGPLGSESEIGVYMSWNYNPVNGIPVGTVAFTDFAVQKENLCDTACNP